MTGQDERVTLQPEPEDKLLRRAAVRIPIPIPPGAAAQRSRLDADPVPYSVVGARELVEPDLPDGIPPAVRVAQEEVDRLVSFPSRGPLLASVVDGIAKRLVQ